MFRVLDVAAVTNCYSLSALKTALIHLTVLPAGHKSAVFLLPLSAGLVAKDVACAPMMNLCGAGDQTRGFRNPRNYIASP